MMIADRLRLRAVLGMTTMIFLGTGCLPQQRMTLTDPIVMGRSGDERHVAWVVQKNNGKVELAVDGSIRSSEYDGIAAVAFSPDGSRTAYSVKINGAWKMTIDGEEDGPAFDEISIIDIAWSPDGKRLAYGARRGDRWYAVVNGRPILERGHDAVRKLSFSPDGRRFAYCAVTGARQAFIIDGVSGPFFDKITDPLWSPDGKRFAYIAKEKGLRSFVIDGKPGNWYEDITSPVFSHDGRRYAYGARKNGKSFVVTDGREGPRFNMKEPITAIKFAPADDRLGYAAEKDEQAGWVMIIDGVEGPSFPYIAGATLTYNPANDNFAYVAAGTNGWMVVDAHGVGPVWDGIIGPVFSRTGNHLAYGAVKKNRLFLFIDGPTLLDPEIRDIDYLEFSPDGKHFMYKAIGKNKQFAVLDGRAGPPYDRIYKPSFTESGVEYLGERESDGCLWRAFIPFVPDGGEASAAERAAPMEKKLGWLPTKESLNRPCAVCEKKDELQKEENE